MKIVSQRMRHEIERFDLFFERLDAPGSGYAFECDAQGAVFLDKLQHAGRQSYEHVTGDGAALYAPPRIDRSVNRWVEPALGQCDCGRYVRLEGFTNPCVCGADYNSAGQRLAPREQWGEETGESLSDILRIR